jgi:pyruvate/2-oxoglutarate/acetoin dehydrogenase E1 component
MSTGNVSTREIINQVLRSELARNPRAIILGETVSWMGSTGVMGGLHGEFGDRQVLETPVSENGILGAALGLALAGWVPIVEVYSADFLLAVANEVLNDIPKWRQQHGIGSPLPITIRAPMGGRDGKGPEHSQSMPPFLQHAPGITVVVPSSPRDAGGLLRSSIRAPEPVIFLEDRRIYDLRGSTGDLDHEMALGAAETVLAGEDVTIVAWADAVNLARAAAEVLAQEGISVEVINPLTIKPMDWTTVLASVSRTRRLVVVEEAPITGGVGAEIVARCAESVPEVRPRRVAMPDVIRPYSASMEATILPAVDDVIEGVRKVLS